MCSSNLNSESVHDFEVQLYVFSIQVSDISLTNTLLTVQLQFVLLKSIHIAYLSQAALLEVER